MKQASLFLISVFSLTALVTGCVRPAWSYASGEYAMCYHRLDLGLSYQQCKPAIEKEGRGEKLTGQKFDLRSGSLQASVVAQLGEPLKRRPSKHWCCDEEWEYKVCIVYLKRGVVQDLLFKDAHDEPKPIYRWSGRDMPL